MLFLLFGYFTTFYFSWFCFSSFHKFEWPLKPPLLCSNSTGLLACLWIWNRFGFAWWFFFLSTRSLPQSPHLDYKGSICLFFKSCLKYHVLWQSFIFHTPLYFRAPATIPQTFLHFSFIALVSIHFLILITPIGEISK